MQKRFGKRIQEMRMQLGYSQEELCNRAGLNRTYLSDLERGRGNATLAVISKLSGALGVELSDLLAGIDNADRKPPRILLVAAEKQSNELKRALSGYATSICTDFEQAKQQLEDGKFDAVVCSFSVGERMFDLMRLVRLLPKHAATPIVCTGSPPREHNKLFRAALEIAVSAYSGVVLFGTDGTHGNHNQSMTARLRQQLEFLLFNRRLKQKQ